MGVKAKEILDCFVAKMRNSELIHRYDIEEQFEKMDKRYKDVQRVELLLKKEAKENDGYKQLFEMLYGDMPKYGGGGFKL